MICMLIPMVVNAGQKRFTTGPVVNRLEPIGKALFDDGISFGFRFGYNFDKHIAAELSYDYLYNLSQDTVAGKPTTNGHQLMANFLYNVKDDRGFIPYMTFGLGVEKYDNSRGSLRSGGIAGVGLGAHFLLMEPVSLRFEVKDIVRFSDVGHTFVWTLGLEYAFGKMERYVEEEPLPFTLYPPRKTPEEPPRPAARPVTTPPVEAAPTKRDAQIRVTKVQEAVQKSLESPKRSLTPPKRIAETALETPSVPAVVAPKIEAPEKPLSAAELRKMASDEPKEIAAAPVREQIIPLEAPEEPEQRAQTVAEPVRKPAEPVVEPVEEAPEPAIERRSVVSETPAAEKTEVPSPPPVADETPPVKEPAIARAADEPAPEPAKALASTMPAESSVYAAKPPAVVKEDSSEDPCRLDGDGDGVADCNDRCEETPKGWRVDADGCAVAVTMLVTFDFDSARLDEWGRDRIGLLVTYMQKRPEIGVVIEGHTDSIGTDRYNLELSKRRALVVKDALIGLGIKADRIAVKAYGERRPLASNDTPAGRAKNRRDDAVIIRYQGR